MCNHEHEHEHDMRAQLTTVERVVQFIQGGNATITLRSVKTGVRFTYKIRESDDGRVFFVGLLRGSNNESDYSFLGTIRNGVYTHGRKSRITADTQSAKAFTWFWRMVSNNQLPDTVECWHEGRCGRCGRTLTVPESIADGFGPECIKHVGGNGREPSFPWEQ